MLDEDPFLWQDVRGNFHLLMHYFVFWGDPFVGAHAFSRDAKTWYTHHFLILFVGMHLTLDVFNQCIGCSNRVTLIRQR
jgi:hypothetical protein